MDNGFILVVDDNHINRLFFESSFKKHGYQVSLAENGYQAIELCQANSFNLILMDIRMNGMDGMQTAAAIKNIDSQANTPIIAISAERFDWQSHPAFTSSLLKPISQEDIQHIITTYLSTIKIFDHKDAMKISHDDEEIVAKLRKMLVEQLPNDWLQIVQLNATSDLSGLDALLHKMAGSAKVCAASLLTKHLILLKQNLKNDLLREKHLHQLKAAIDKTIQNCSENL